MGRIAGCFSEAPKGFKNFVETGTGEGISANIAHSWGLKVYTIEADKRLFNPINPEINYYLGWSTEVLPKVLRDISEEPTLFWLDAHFFGSDYFGVAYNALPEAVRCPAEEEFKIICENRDVSKDIFVFDDFRLYKDLPGVARPSVEIFINDGAPWASLDTHNREEMGLHEGYLILTPKETL